MDVKACTDKQKTPHCEKDAAASTATVNNPPNWCQGLFVSCQPLWCTPLTRDRRCEGRPIDGERTDRGTGRNAAAHTLLCEATIWTVKREVCLCAWMLNCAPGLDKCLRAPCICVYMNVCVCVKWQWCPPNLCSVNCKNSYSVTSLCVHWIHTQTHTHKTTVHKCHLSQITMLLHCVLSSCVMLKLSWKQDWQWKQYTDSLHTLHTHTNWASELKELSAADLGRPAGVPTQTSNKIKREKVESRSGYGRHPVWPSANKPWLLSTQTVR